MQLFFIESAIRFEVGENAGMDDARQKIVEHYELVVETNFLLNLTEREVLILRGDAVMKSLEQSLKLRNDRVLIVSRIADERPAIFSACQIHSALVHAAGKWLFP